MVSRVTDDYEAMIRQQNQLLDALTEQLSAGTGIVASKEVNARLEEMAEFYRVMRGAMEDATRRWKQGRRPRRGAKSRGDVAWKRQ